LIKGELGGEEGGIYVYVDINKKIFENLVGHNNSNTKFVRQTLEGAQKESEMLLPAGQLASPCVIRPAGM